MTQQQPPALAASKPAPQSWIIPFVLALGFWCAALTFYYLANRSDCFAALLLLIAGVLLFCLPAAICAVVSIYRRPLTIVGLALSGAALAAAARYLVSTIDKCYCGCGYPG
ncbi:MULTISPECIES: hypothetical protein [Lysobacter]|jgi:hypothetical protein|uniref:hypothetical protein n=1 Tax=Lysobacter TaxID=68 RepID=UPI001F2C0804|nr:MULTISPECIES: hypothetical protein [Lysobacter]UJB17304.1 hypothetical protein L1A79_12980 [Lysobacter capsici]UJQ28973.1 hypothetical protein L2D09_01885 [Lysobacter gummosus]